MWARRVANPDSRFASSQDAQWMDLANLANSFWWRDLDKSGNNRKNFISNLRRYVFTFQLEDEYTELVEWVDKTYSRRKKYSKSSDWTLRSELDREATRTYYEYIQQIATLVIQKIKETWPEPDEEKLNPYKGKSFCVINFLPCSTFAKLIKK